MYCFIVCMDLYSAGLIASIYYKIGDRCLIAVYSWIYDGKAYFKARSYGIYKELLFVCIKLTDILILLYALTCILPVALLEPIIMQ